MTGADCVMCARVAGEGPLFVADLPTSRVYFNEDQFFPGWVFVVLKRHAIELYELEASERAAQILVTAGTSPAMLLLFSTLLDPGDEVLLTDPRYAVYPNLIRYPGGECVHTPTWEADGFQCRPAEFASRLTPRSKAVLINSPANPTGAVMTAESLRETARLGPWIISDEIYHGLTYEGAEHSILEFTDHAFVLNGFSKA